MFGYVAANPEKLNSEQKTRYRALYCGLCSELGKAGNNIYKSVLSYDLVFAVMLISSVLKTDFTESSRRCAVHPSKKHTELSNIITAYCADMNILLAYYKCLDDIADEHSVVATVNEKAMRAKKEEIEKKYPEKCAKIVDCLNKISQAEKQNILNPEVPAALFGEIMAQVLIYDNSKEANSVYLLGTTLGRAIYVLDAALDLKDDIKHQRYNPLIRFSSQSTYDILNMLFACVCEEFQKLNLEQDKDIIENILLSGVWMKYPLTDNREKKDDNRSL